MARLSTVAVGVRQPSGDQVREIRLAPATPTMLDVAKTVRPVVFVRSEHAGECVPQARPGALSSEAKYRLSSCNRMEPPYVSEQRTPLYARSFADRLP